MGQFLLLYCSVHSSVPENFSFSCNTGSMPGSPVTSPIGESSFGVKSVCQWTGTGIAWVAFVNSGWRRHVGHGMGKKTRKHVNAIITKSRRHLGVKLAPV